MYTTHLNTSVDFCTEGRWSGWRATDPNFAGLSLQLTSTGKPIVVTGGPCHRKFLAGGNTPVEVNAELFIDGDISIETMQVHYTFGDRDNHVDQSIVDAAAAIVERFAALIVANAHFVAKLAELNAKIAERRRHANAIGAAETLDALAESVQWWAQQLREGADLPADFEELLVRDTEQAVVSVTDLMGVTGA